MAEPLRLHAVSKRYGSRGPWVLRGVDLEVAPGSLVRIDGGNGSGKSTLLAVMAGIGKPNRGRITGGGRTAYVPERLPEVLPYDVDGYLARLGAVHGLPPEDARERAAFWLGRLGAAAWAKAPMSVLSKGTAQKVALVQALMADADVLVLDEAWSGLDADARAVLDDAVDERLALGATVVLVDHQQGDRPHRTADVYLVRDGAVVRRPRPERTERPTRTAPPADTSGRLLDLMEIEFDDGQQRTTIRVPASNSDDTLRTVLARPNHHVRSVRPLG